MMFTPNPREVIGGNNPPPEAPPSALDSAALTIADLDAFLDNHPVIVDDEEARGAKAIIDRVASHFRSIEEERKSQVAPLNKQASEINAKYHRWHCASGKPGEWDLLQKEAKRRVALFMAAEEAKARAAAEAAWLAKEKADQEAREAAEREEQARAEAEAGVCDVGLAEAIQGARETSAEAMKANRVLARAERDTTARIGGGSGKVMTLRNHEVLAVTNCLAAIEALSDDDGNIPQRIADAILTCARTYRQEHGRLPAGVTASNERSL